MEAHGHYTPEDDITCDDAEPEESTARFQGATAFLHKALDNALAAMCADRTLDCPFDKMAINIVVVPKRQVDAHTIPSPQGDRLDVVVSTALLDFSSNAEAALVHQRYHPWINHLRQMRCSERLPKEVRDDELEIGGDNLVVTAEQIVYTFVFAHELAHLVQGRTCGYTGTDSMGREMQCDHLALEALSRLGVLSVTESVASFFDAIDQYATWEGERPDILTDKRDATTAPAFPPIDWGVRGQAMLDQWASYCLLHGSSDVANCPSVWKKAVEEARELEWYARPNVCSRDIVGNGSASTDVSAGPALADVWQCLRTVDIPSDVANRWNTRNGFVNVDYGFSNLCDVDAQCTMLLASGTVERIRPPDGHWHWSYYYGKLVRIRIPRNSSIHAKATLRWYATADRMPQVRTPDAFSSRNFASCSFSRPPDINSIACDEVERLSRLRFSDVVGPAAQLDKSGTVVKRFARVRFRWFDACYASEPGRAVVCDATDERFAEIASELGTCVHVSAPNAGSYEQRYKSLRWNVQNLQPDADSEAHTRLTISWEK